MCYANSKITLYFMNDSINGLKPSDAYETHNMGLKYNVNNIFFQIDLGLLTPDMFSYENKYRDANRSFGELINLRYGTENYNDNLSIFLNYTAQGKFGIDKLQNIVHRIANFQNDNLILEKVRMPDAQWVGAGLVYKDKFDLIKNTNHYIVYNSYIGTDKSSFGAGLELNLIKNDTNKFMIKTSLSYVPYDNIVSADPVNANHRVLLPKLVLGYTKTFNDISINVFEEITLPTIDNDDKPYIRFGASLSFPVKF